MYNIFLYYTHNSAVPNQRPWNNIPTNEQGNYIRVTGKNKKENDTKKVRAPGTRPTTSTTTTVVFEKVQIY